MVKGTNPLHTTLIPAAANRETRGACTVVPEAPDASEAIHVAARGIGPGPDGGGPPISGPVHAAEISEVVPKAARQGIEAR